MTQAAQAQARYNLHDFKAGGPADDPDVCRSCYGSKSEHGSVPTAALNDPQQQSATVLTTADQTIHQDRHAEYGTAEDSFGRIAKLWSTYLDKEVDAHDVAMLMVLLKVSRSATDHKLDTYVDMAGYAALGYRMTKGDT